MKKQSKLIKKLISAITTVIGAILCGIGIHLLIFKPIMLYIIFGTTSVFLGASIFIISIYFFLSQIIDI